MIHRQAYPVCTKRLGPILRLYLLDLCPYFTERLIPGNLHKLIAHPFERMIQSILVVLKILQCTAFSAAIAAQRSHAGGIRSDIDHMIILNLNLQTTADTAVIAARLSPFTHGNLHSFICGFETHSVIRNAAPISLPIT